MSVSGIFTDRGDGRWDAVKEGNGNRILPLEKKNGDIFTFVGGP